MNLKAVNLILYCFVYIQIAGQQLVNGINSKNAIQIGDNIKKLFFHSFINYPSKNGSIADFHGKLVVLDFWTIGCAGCISSWPHLIELQEQYKNQIQIVLVDPWDDQNLVHHVLNTRKQLRNVNMTLPCVCRDTALLKIFPVDAVPCLYWVDENGILIAITEKETLNAKNIAAVLDHRPINLHRFVDIYKVPEPDVFKPLFVNGNGGQITDIMWQSILTKGIDSIRGGNGLRVSTSNMSAYAINASIRDLYRLAYSNSLSFDGFRKMLPLSRIKLDVPDSSKYVNFIDGEKNRDCLYNYHLFAHLSDLDSLQLFMQADLDRYFKLHVKWEKVTKPCYVLSCSDTSAIVYKAGDRVFYIKPDSLMLNKVAIRDLFSGMEDATSYHDSYYPLLNETGYEGLVGGISTMVDIEDANALNVALLPYHLQFALQKRVVEVLVLSEN